MEANKITPVRVLRQKRNELIKKQTYYDYNGKYEDQKYVLKKVIGRRIYE